MSVVSTALFVLSCLVLLYCSIPPVKKKLRRIVRPVMLLSVLLIYLFHAEAISIPVLIALLLICVGGAVLTKQEKLPVLRIGYLFYASGTLLYAVICLLSMNRRPTALFCILATVLYAVFLAACLYMLTPHLDEGLSGAACALMGSACLFSLSALLFAFHGGSSGSLLLYIGSLFWIGCCDEHLHHRFVRHIPAGRFIVMLTYICALALIVFGSVS